MSNQDNTDIKAVAEWTNDVKYISKLIKSWEESGIEEKSNILYEFYYYRQKFERDLESNTEVRFVASDLRQVLDSINLLLKTISEDDTQRIYDLRSKGNKSPTKKVDKIKYSLADEEKEFKGVIHKKTKKHVYTNPVAYYGKRIISKIIIIGVLIFVIGSGSIGTLTEKVVNKVSHGAEVKTQINNEDSEKSLDGGAGIPIAKITSLVAMTTGMIAFLILGVNVLFVSADVLCLTSPFLREELEKRRLVSSLALESIDASLAPPTEVEKMEKLTFSDKIDRAKEMYVGINGSSEISNIEKLDRLGKLGKGLNSKSYIERYRCASNIELIYTSMKAEGKV